MCHTHQSTKRRRSALNGRPPSAAELAPPTLLSRPIRIGLCLALAGIIVLAFGLLLWPLYDQSALKSGLRVAAVGLGLLLTTL